MNPDVLFLGIFEHSRAPLHDQRHAFANPEDILVVGFRQDKLLRLGRSFHGLRSNLLRLLRQFVGLRWIRYLAERKFDPLGRLAGLLGCPMPLVEPWTDEGWKRGVVSIAIIPKTLQGVL